MAPSKSFPVPESSQLAACIFRLQKSLEMLTLRCKVARHGPPALQLCISNIVANCFEPRICTSGSGEAEERRCCGSRTSGLESSHKESKLSRGSNFPTIRGHFRYSTTAVDHLIN
ncbi:hypothetical protein HZ326_1373 [Fusarium oxysporum f. sp. albedinis]|nr:hypothetical protein HZ326_1373 [Fusarium oxysporum f. sp. albedinis]